MVHLRWPLGHCYPTWTLDICCHNFFLLISRTYCNYKAAVLYKMSLPIGMCYKINGKTTFYVTTKSLGTQNWLCMHLCYLIIMNAWCRLYYTYNLELLWYRPRHVISSFARPFSWHSPLATSQNNLHSIKTSVSEFLCIHYQYMQTLQKNYINKWKYIFFIFLGFGGDLGRPTVFGPAAFTAVDFAAFVKFALLLTRRGRPPNCSGTSTSSCRTYPFMFLRRQFET